jgi:hypothetical protein
LLPRFNVWREEFGKLYVEALCAESLAALKVHDATSPSRHVLSLPERRPRS